VKVPTRLLLVSTLGALAACSLAFRGEDYFSGPSAAGPSVDAGPVDAPTDSISKLDGNVDSAVVVPGVDAGCPNGGTFCDNFEGDSGLMWMPNTSSNAAMVRVDSVRGKDGGMSLHSSRAEAGGRDNAQFVLQLDRGYRRCSFDTFYEHLGSGGTAQQVFAFDYPTIGAPSPLSGHSVSVYLGHKRDGKISEFGTYRSGAPALNKNTPVAALSSGRWIHVELTSKGPSETAWVLTIDDIDVPFDTESTASFTQPRLFIGAGYTQDLGHGYELFVDNIECSLR